MKKTLLSIFIASLMLCCIFTVSASADGNPVAKVGNTNYYSIEEALENWSNGSTLTLLSDVKLSDTVILKSTEHHILDLSSYTLTAADGKNAFQIIACGTGGSERTAITIKASQENPGTINAGNKSIVYYDYSKNAQTTGDDRPIIKIEGGIFYGSTSSAGTGGFFAKGSASRKCATFNITGGTFNCSVIGTGKNKLTISGGTFNYTVSSQGDSTSYRLISGGKFKNLGFMTADSNKTKFGIGTSMGNYNVGCYVNDEGYLVIGGPVITNPTSGYEVISTASTFSSYLKYSSAQANNLYWTSAEAAFSTKPYGSFIPLSDSLDLNDSNFSGTFKINDANKKLKISFNEGITPKFKVNSDTAGYVAVYTETILSGKVERTYFLVPVNINIANSGTVSATTPIEAAKGAITAVPKSGYIFVDWTVTSANTGSNITSETISVDPDAIPTLITANFSKKLTGELLITGTAEVGSSLSCSLNNSNNTGDLSYQWYRFNEESQIIEGAKDSTYIVTEDDVQYRIYCVVTSSALAGTVESAKTAPVSLLTFADGSISSSGYEGVYDGNNHSINVSIPEGSTVYFSADGINYGINPILFKNAGSYTVYYRVEKDKYESITGQETVIITPRELTVTANDIFAKPGAFWELTYKVEGFVDGDNFITKPKMTTAEDIPGYSLLIIPIGADAGSNYTITYVNGRLIFEAIINEITKPEITLPDVDDDEDKENCNLEACPLATYNDLEVDAWYHDSIHYCVEAKLFKGVSEDLFDPDGSITRAMIVTILWRLEGSPLVTGINSFTDVSENEWYTEGIKWAAEENLVLGYGDGNFGTNDAITHEQLATILYRYEIYKNGNINYNNKVTLNSPKVSDWAYSAVCWVNSYSDDSHPVFVPKASATRAETAVVLHKYCEFLTKK